MLKNIHIKIRKGSTAYPMVVLMITLILVACRATPIGTSAPLSATATQTPSPAPTLAPTDTLTPTPTKISNLPGFEDWSIFNPYAIDFATDGNDLILTLKHRALWFMNQRGVLVHKLMEGDFKITADVYTAKQSDASQPPGGDGTVQLGGIMTRNGMGGPENYVFIVVGDDGNGLSVETKNTTDNFSRYDGPAWDSASAKLRICRVGQTFNLYKRHIDSDEAWLLAASFDRPDLPTSLQVGLNIYSNSTPDLQVRYENIKIENLADPSECEMG